MGFSCSSKPVVFRAISMSFFNFLSQKNTQVNFLDQRLFETEVIKENLYLNCEPRHTNLPFIKSTINSEMLIFSGLSYLYDTYHWWKFLKDPWVRVFVKRFCLIWHEVIALKTWILQTQTTTEKIDFTGYLILGKINFSNLKNEHLKKKKPKKLEILHFMTTFQNVALKTEIIF